MDFPLSKHLIEHPIDNEILWAFWVLDFLFLFSAGLIIWFLFTWIEDLTGKWQTFYGTIVDKLYKPAQSSSGTGVGIVSGQAAIVSTSNHSLEQWFVMVKKENNKEVEKVYCSDDFFYNHNIGDKIAYKGKYSTIRKEKLISEYKAEEA